MANSYLSVGHLQGIGSCDLEGDDSTAKERAGRYAYVVDAFGTRIFMYGQNLSGSSQGQGLLASRIADVAASNITSGSTTSATLTGTWTANKEIGKMLYVQDNADSAGAAPEGEVSVIGSNSADVVNVDPAYPFSVALAANDDLDTISPGWHLDDAAAGDVAQEIKGLVVAKNGISDANFGWYQCYGIHPQAVLKASTAFTDRAAIIAGTACIDKDANGGWELVIGYTIGTVSSDIVGDRGIVFINTYGPTLNAGTP